MFQNKIKVIIGSVIILFTLTSCNSAFTGNGTGGATLTINLLGNSRVATGFNDAVDSSDLTYSIKLTNNQTGQVKNAVINSAGTDATVTGLAVGDWDILVEVAIFENYPYGRGEIKAFPVSAGQNNATVQMQRLSNAIALDVPNGSRHNFGSVVVGNTPDPFEVTVYNYTDNNPLNVTATFSNSSGFKDISSINIPQDGSLKLTVEPDTGVVGEFNPTLTVSANDSVIASFELSLTVIPLLQIGNVFYETLEEAIAAANSGDTIVVNADITVAATISIAAGKNVTIVPGNNDVTISRAGQMFNVTGGSLTLGGGTGATLTLQGDGTTNGRFLSMTNSTVIMKDDVVISNFRSGALGGGVLVDVNATFTMEGGIIENITGETGGAVSLYGVGGTFTMNGGELRSNTATAGGGGVYVASGIFIFNGGTIYGSDAIPPEYANTAINGAAVRVATGATAEYGDGTPIAAFTDDTIYGKQ